VLEVGPGLGPLTALLIEGSGNVLAIEKDERLVRILEERFASALVATSHSEPKLSLIHADALEFLSGTNHNWSDWKFVANLPYAVASPILVELAQNQPGPKRMVATLQLEVAKRLMAKPDEPDYGILTLLMQLDYQPIAWFKIPAACFFPQPDVDSACVALGRRSQALLQARQRETFVSIVKRSFSQRRKMMAKLLKADWPVDNVDQAFAAVSLPLQIRAEAVSLEQFVSLTGFLHERRDF
jgi:16S rRNA (adenine1518-N6/adenine1519-N6)-dimethyltransferase